MKEGITNNYNAPIFLSGGSTLNGDIVNPTYNISGQKPDGRKLAMDCMEAHIKEQISNNPTNRRLILLPYVAAIRIDLIPNVMKVTDFNEKYGADISQATFSEYVPKEINNSKFSESESASFENELRSLLNL